MLPDDWEATLNAKDARYANWTREAATRNGIPPLLLARLLYKESQYNPNASSLAGYKGIAQLGPGALQSIGIKGKFDYFDAKSSIDAGAAYLAWLHRGLGDWPRAVASYNAGLGNVGRWLAGDDIKYSPNEETKETIRHIFRGNPKAFDQ